MSEPDYYLCGHAGNCSVCKMANKAVSERITELEKELEEVKSSHTFDNSCVVTKNENERLKAEVARLQGQSGSCVECERLSRELAGLKAQINKFHTDASPKLEAIKEQLESKNREIAELRERDSFISPEIIAINEERFQSVLKLKTEIAYLKIKNKELIKDITSEIDLGHEKWIKLESQNATIAKLTEERNDFQTNAGAQKRENFLLKTQVEKKSAEIAKLRAQFIAVASCDDCKVCKDRAKTILDQTKGE